VLSGDPRGTTTLHGVEARSRSPLMVVAALVGARGLLCGGGSLVQDVTSARSAAYYLGTMWAAQARGVPVAVLGQGIGPLRRPWVRSAARAAFERAALISVRDAQSEELLRGLGVRRPIHRGADLAFLMVRASEDRAHRLLARLDAARARIGLAVRNWPGLDPAAIGQEVGRFARAHGAAAVVLPFDLARDKSASAAAAAAAGAQVVEAALPQTLQTLVGAMDLIVAVRLHAMVFAAAAGVPAVGIAYDPKVAAFTAEAGLPPAVPGGAPAAVLREALDAAWEARVEIRRRLQGAVPDLRRRAAESVAASARVLAQPMPGS
jgi:polysaccharide pyruvyl transferase CsaB